MASKTNDERVRELMAGDLAARVAAAKPQARAAQPCLCGCGGTPKGSRSRFLPGHDAKLAGKLRWLARSGDEDAKTALADLGWDAE